MTLNVTMNAPAGFGGEITGMPSGQLYNVGPTGIVSVNVHDINSFIALGFQASPNTVSNIGTPGTGTTAVEYGDSYNHSTVLAINGVLPNIPGGASLGLGLLLYTFPAGAQIVDASNVSVGITQTAGHINADTPTVGLGSVIASGAVAVLSGTATFQDINVGKAAANCTGTKTVQTKIPTSTPFAFISEAAGSKAIYFNAAFAWAASGDPAAIVAGSVILGWRQMS